MTLKAYDVVINGHETTLLLDKHDAKIYGVTEDQDEVEDEEAEGDSAAPRQSRPSPSQRPTTTTAKKVARR